MLSSVFRVIQEINVEISNDIYISIYHEILTPKANALVRHSLMDWWIGQARCPGAGAQLVGWSGTAGAGLMGNADTSSVMKFHGVAGGFCIHSSYFTGFLLFFFKYTAAAPQIYSITQWHIFVLWPWGVSLSCSARNRQEVIRAASVTEMHPAAGMQLETPR